MEAARTLPRTLRLDASDRFVFDMAAEPGEWAVSGAFAFLGGDPAALTGKRRQAFSNGFLGLDSLGWSTMVTVATATADEAAAAVRALARRLVEDFGCPTAEMARAAAAEEVAFAAELCREHPPGTLLAVSRRVEADGQIREAFRVVPPPGERDHARIWTIVPDTEQNAAGKGGKEDGA
ncbi:DUF6505 family protein [Oleisolibacter albus]|uniref:DUF6505 family protein n=1 Tax=Oleisolibacter albus TaxID=2171757 RepID=UPI000DF33A6F|nr:DUF6505 family protein [Oleisolibacter albus]